MIKKFGFNAFYVIYTLLSGWVFLSAVSNVEGGILGNSVVTGGMLIIFGILSFVAVNAKEIPVKTYRALVLAGFVAFFVCIFVFGTITMTAPLSDLAVLIEAADYWLENGNILSYSYYFTICKNTLGNCIFIYLMFLPCHRLGINIYSDIAECWGIAINSLMIVLTVYCMYRIAVRLFKNRNCQLLFLLMCYCYIPFYLWAHRYYSDTLSLAFLPLGILMYIKARENSGKNKIIYSVLCGISLWIGYFIRGGIIIVLVAIVLYSAFCDDKQFIKTGLRILLSFAITMVCWNKYVDSCRWIDYSNKAIDDYPLTMWFMYGAHGEGNYNDDDVNLLNNCPDYASRKELAREKLKEYYSQYTVNSYLEFLTLKFGITYGNGLFDTEKYLNNQRHSNFTHYFLLDGMPYTAAFRYITNGLHIFTLIMAFISGLVNWKNKQWNTTMLMQIILVGNFIFFSFWETKARYAFGITPVLVYLSLFTIVKIAVFISEKVRYSNNETIEV